MSEIAADLTALQLALIGLLNDPVAERVLAFIDGFQSLLAKQATPLFHALAQPIINAMFSTACIAYKNAVDVASNTVIDDYRKLGNLLSPVASWEAMVEEIRAGACLPPLSLGDLYTIKLEQFTNFYIARLNQPDFTTDFPSLLDEVDFIQEVRGDAVLLGADLLDTRLENEAEVPLFNHLRASAYAACRAASKHDFLGQLRLELAEGGGASFTEDDVLQDLQYCATRLGWQLTESDGTQKGQGTLGGGSSPGSVSRTASAQGVRGGSLVLSQDVRAFRCADGAFAADQLILTVGGVELQRLNPGANGNFFAAPVTIHGQQLLSAAGIDPDATGTHRLEIARSTSTCASNYVQSTEGAVTLATIDLQYPADEEALDIDGVWALHVDGMCHGLINFKQQGASFTVSGGLDGINCPYSTSGSGSGTLSGLAISAGIAFNGIGQVNFTGAVSADGKSMGGTYTRQGGSGSWTAVR
ncbi:MAG TPA: hypothetical protein VLE53_07055 [Gemmatimonadaceae bacterium]|nr:hypothetical protein [Gemmatimonadaceae bacterium]